MKKFMIIAAVATIVVPAVVAVALYVHYVGSTETLIELHPEIDPTIVRKVSSEMLREALKGEYSDLNLTDNDYEALFLSKVMQHQP